MKSFKPFIREFLVFLFVAIIVVSIIDCGEYIQVIIKPHLISYLIMLFFLLSIVFAYRHIIRDGVSSIIDCLCKTKCEAKVVFLESRQDYMSAFSDRFTSEGMRTYETKARYIYIFYNKQKKLFLQSHEPFNIVPSKKYLVTYGKYSKVILSIQDN